MEEDQRMSNNPPEGFSHNADRIASALGYYLPEHALYQLTRFQHFLEFLSRMAAPRTPEDDRAGRITVTPDELAYCFQLLAREINPMLADIEGPAHVTLTYIDPAD